MKTVIAIIVAIVVIAAGYFLFVHKAAAPTTAQPAAPVEATPTASSTGAAPVNAAATVTYTNQGFSPSTVTIKKGQTVEFVNNSAGSMCIASNPHPIHNGYSGTTQTQHCPNTAGIAFDECTLVSSGGTYTFTFQKVGSWGYHNHADHSMTGTVVVTAS